MDPLVEVGASAFMRQMLAAGNRRVMDVTVETAPHLSLSAYFGTTKFIQQQPDVTARFTRAMNASLDYPPAGYTELDHAAQHDRAEMVCNKGMSTQSHWEGLASRRASSSPNADFHTTGSGQPGRANI